MKANTRTSCLAADLGGTKIRAARLDALGRIQELVETPTPVAGGEAVARALIAALRRLRRPTTQGAGVDVPGLAYPDGSVWAPNLRGWQRFPLHERLHRALSLPVLVESDRNAFIAGEVWRGQARGCRDAVAVMLGTGIGAGIWSGGRLLRGRHELAGAIGWLAVEREFRPGYAERGCLESHAAGPALAAAARAAGRDWDTPALVRRARAGDRLARGLLAEAGAVLGRGLANLVSLLNPELIIISGGFAEAAGELLLAPARRELRRWAQPLAARQARLVTSRLGARAPLLGLAGIIFGALPAATNWPRADAIDSVMHERAPAPLFLNSRRTRNA